MYCICIELVLYLFCICFVFVLYLFCICFVFVLADYVGSMQADCGATHPVLEDLLSWLVNRILYVLYVRTTIVNGI